MYDALTSSPGMNREQNANTNASNPWHTLIEEYSKLDLTQEMDRLPALSGIASPRGGDSYLAGIWTDQLPGSLCWTTSPSQHFPVRRPHGYRAPSFSWASVEGPIKYCRALSAKRQEWDIITPEQTSYTAATVVSSASTVEGLDPCGRVKAGHVEIEGWVGTAAVVQVAQEKYRSVCTLQQADRLQKFYLDIPLSLCRSEPAEVRTRDDVLLLLLECEKISPSTFYKHGYRVMTLVLKRSAEYPGVYERVGLVFPADDLTVYFSNFQSGGADIGDGSSMFDDAPGWFNEKKTVRIV
ncbi:HET-domain-containing protein [Neofusicoccum parvum]|nr:HET-domain-containing protein [Neofusicoccum parvum]